MVARAPACPRVDKDLREIRRLLLSTDQPWKHRWSSRYQPLPAVLIRKIAGTPSMPCEESKSPFITGANNDVQVPDQYNGFSFLIVARPGP